MIRKNKNSYYQSQFEICKGDPRQTWNLINECLNRKKVNPKMQMKNSFLMEYENDLEIANQFNLFYKNIAIDISKNIEKPVNPPNYYLEKSKGPDEPFFLTKITENDVKSAVMSLSSKSSTGPDKISNKVLKMILPHIITDLTSCINKSLQESKFPQILKVSKITPIFKQKQDRTNPDNW